MVGEGQDRDMGTDERRLLDSRKFQVEGTKDSESRRGGM